jgi:Protein of unknown function (DUF3602)
LNRASLKQLSNTKIKLKNMGYHGKKVSHGRGGAGNIYPSQAEYVDGLNYSHRAPSVCIPRPISSSIDLLQQAGRNGYFSTGIGGAGNMRRYSLNDVHRMEAIPEEPQRVPRASAVGRGGWGNISEFRRLERLRMEHQAGHERQSHDHLIRGGSAPPQKTKGILEMGLAQWSKKRFPFKN